MSSRPPSSPFFAFDKTAEAVTQTLMLPRVLPTGRAALEALLRAQQQAHLVAVQTLHEAMHDALHEALHNALLKALQEETQVIREEARREAQLEAQQETQRQIARLLEQIALARHRMFGASTEQLSAQSRLFDEAETLAATSTADQDIAPIAPISPPDPSGAAGLPAPQAGAPSPQPKPARGKRAPLAAGLMRVDVIHDVPHAQRTCACGTPMVEIGQDVSEQLDIVPMQVRVLRHIRKRYACPGSRHAPVTAALPAQPLPKSNASADFLAMLLTVKFVDGLPLARFEKVLARHDAVVPRQSQARWVIGCGGCDCSPCTT